MDLTPIRLMLWAPGLLLATPAAAGPWFPCGSFSDLNLTKNCQLDRYPVTHFEYAIQYNSAEPLPVVCTTWNYGFRIYNKLPIVVESDNPQGVMRWGGAIFYTATTASDDDTCGVGTWRHKYWRLDQNNTVTTAWTNGCLNLPLLCRER
ncbi:hypothetical protein LZ198_27890 [Myxococcus sp. K15C18031901]|uniref:hypothetical protein n=1 Tax=Myxococcus dinghuensis TaxID=2906761 RepID=UPI0020A70B40|nr:hypothetical protein [Myxococcus dinghuensis]MCP3102703.1 hypothetical protein [Myxococcus dinghuensis]